MAKFIIFIFIIIAYNSSLIAMDKKPYHHLPDGTFRNPEGSPVRFKASAEKYGFNKEDAIIFKVGEIQPIDTLLSK